MSDGEDRVMGMEDEVRDESGNGERRQRMRETKQENANLLNSATVKRKLQDLRL